MIEPDETFDGTWPYKPNCKMFRLELMNPTTTTSTLCRSAAGSNLKQA